MQKHVLASKNMELSVTTQLSHNTETTLEHVLDIMPELIRWLVKSGIGYSEFSAALRPLFYNEAIKELDRIAQKKTDSSISILSGLTRREVNAFRPPDSKQHVCIDMQQFLMPVSVPARVVGLWIHQRLPFRIPITGSEESFESLVQQISSEKHPRSILLELKRLGVVVEINDDVILQTGSFTPSPHADESKKLFAESIVDHLAAGIHNITEGDDAFLEQAIFADELTYESVVELKKLCVDQWQTMAKTVLARTMELCRKDEGKLDASYRFRLGVFQYEAMEQHIVGINSSRNSCKESGS
ncbi:hypothetical protein F2A31_05535 [Acinetobacter suaedae]|uniref:Uncharacterized protein n=1 Tax=Acinetobacter suaedae TaxID=2609668 RepID=A0A5P1USR4_9GAMM|nr:DUF6502 family protein [Acinetobacter sp. C16S1]QER39192.1 hypothetical protein F2A31_05535 [Acinetobacter sp. C16S1]